MAKDADQECKIGIPIVMDLNLYTHNIYIGKST